MTSYTSYTDPHVNPSLACFTGSHIHLTYLSEISYIVVEYWMIYRTGLHTGWHSRLVLGLVVFVVPPPPSSADISPVVVCIIITSGYYTIVCGLFPMRRRSSGSYLYSQDIYVCFLIQQCNSGSVYENKMTIFWVWNVVGGRWFLIHVVCECLWHNHFYRRTRFLVRMNYRSLSPTIG